MYKLDFHIHTQKCKQGDGSKRNIKPEKFVNVIKDNNVSMCAITNHNKFDIEEYEKIIQIDTELVIFPGIELDVIDSTNQYHIVVIGDPDKRASFYKVFDNEKDRDYDEFNLEYAEFIENIKKFQDDEIMVIPHFLDKDKKRAISESFKDKLVQDLKNYVIILEPGKLTTMGIINAHNEIALVGSDVKDWNLYHESNLPEIKFRITTFKRFIELAKDKSLLIKGLIDDTPYEVVPVNESSMKIYEDINVVFGEKGSGKTILLERYILPFFKSSGKKVVHHKGADYEKRYGDILNRCIDELEIQEDKVTELSQLLDKIFTYSEKPLRDYVKEYFDANRSTAGNRNRGKILKLNSTSYGSNIDVLELRRSLKKKIKSITAVKTLNEEVTRNIKDQQALENELKKLRDDLYKEAINSFRESFTNKSIDVFLSSLKKSVDKKTNSKSKPNNIGFANLVNERLKRLKANNEILKLLEEVEDSKTYHLGVLPGKEMVELEVKVMVLKENTTYNESPFDKAAITRNRKIIKKINEFNYTCFGGDINSYFTEVEELTGEQFASQIIKKYPESGKPYSSEKPFPGMSMLIDGEMKAYKPSDGEKSIISVVAVLENADYDCYIFDELERGLGHKYIADYIIPKVKVLRDMGKTLVLSTHNANIAISTLPSQCIYCRYPNEKGYYLTGNMYSDELENIIDTKEIVNWEPLAIKNLEGNEAMFIRRKNVWSQ